MEKCKSNYRNLAKILNATQLNFRRDLPTVVSTGSSGVSGVSGVLGTNDTELRVHPISSGMERRQGSDRRHSSKERRNDGERRVAVDRRQSDLVWPAAEERRYRKRRSQARRLRPDRRGRNDTAQATFKRFPWHDAANVTACAEPCIKGIHDSEQASSSSKQGKPACGTIVNITV